MQQTGEGEIREREKSLRLKADLTLGSVTTDQNPLKAIDHFHYSSHVPHLETVYQTQRVRLHSVHTQSAHTGYSRKRKRVCTKNNTAFDLCQLHLNIYTGWGDESLTANKCLHLYGKTALSLFQWDGAMPALPTSELTGVTNREVSAPFSRGNTCQCLSTTHAHDIYIYTYTAGDSLSPKSSFNVPMWGFIANNSRRTEFWISDSPVWRLSQACEHAAWLKYTPLHCGAEEETCLWKVLCMREKRPLIPDKEPMRDSDKVSASPGPYLMLLSDCTAPTISQSLHPLSTSLKHSHQHHHRHTHTHAQTF